MSSDQTPQRDEDDQQEQEQEQDGPVREDGGQPVASPERKTLPVDEHKGSEEGC